MAMSTGNSGSMLTEINVTPLVDVMLVLLIIFMVTAPMLQTGVDVNLPQAKAQTIPDDEGKLILTVTKDKRVFLGKLQIPWDDVEKTLKNNAKLNAKAAPVEAPKIEDPKTSKEVRKALERARKLGALAMPDEPDEGALNGSKLGTSDHAVGDPYDAEVMGAITQNYNLPAGMTPDQIAQPPEIQFKVSADGTIAGAKLIKSSGNPLVDDACVSAAQQTRRVKAPPGNRARGYAVACRK